MTFSNIATLGISARFRSVFERLLPQVLERDASDLVQIESLAELAPPPPETLLVVAYTAERFTALQDVATPTLLVVPRKSMSSVAVGSGRPGLEFLPATSLTLFDLQRALHALVRPTPESGSTTEGEQLELAERLRMAEETCLQQESKIQELSNQLFALRDQDTLPSAAQREYSLRRIEESISMAQRYKVPLACVLIGIDSLTQIADDAPVDLDDSILAQIAGRLKRSLRNTDLLTLYGQDEFLVVSPFTTSSGAVALSERLRARVAESPIADDQELLEPSLSIGVASFEPSMSKAEDLIESASQALALARSSKEDRITAL